MARPEFDFRHLMAAVLALAACASGSICQAQAPQAPIGAPAATVQKESGEEGDYVISIESELVVLHATVSDKDGKPVADLKQSDFHVFENKVEQQLKVFKREDIPVAVGILVDNSGSMRDKRKGVNAAALKFVKSSNPADEVFIVNFNEEAFLDADFTGNLVLLEDALEKIDARGGTAYYDAIDMSLDHLKSKATLDKRVLIAITDGEDNARARGHLQSQWRHGLLPQEPGRGRPDGQHHRR